MAKETFYFSHDYSARNDPKLQKVLMKLGQSGKGVYWDLIEMLYEESGYLILTEIESYAFALRTDCETINSLINSFELFQKNDINFWSVSVLRRLDLRDEKSKKASESAKTRWYKASALKLYANASENDAIKESKVKEKKENESKVNIIGVDFNFFWNDYDKKAGDKDKIKKKWDALDEQTQNKILDYIPKYKISQPEKQYRKNPETFLNNKGWMDELIFRQNGNKQKPDLTNLTRLSDAILENTGINFGKSNTEE